METRASYVMIGSLVLLMVVALFAFVVWLVGLDKEGGRVEYDILFERSVVGLSTGSPVRYKGIDVGQVRELVIDPEHPDRVRVTIAVREGTPIREDSVATLDSQGFTGLSYVLIEGGSSTSKPLTRKPGEERPVIASRPSPLQELFTDIPSLIGDASYTLSRLHRLLGEENQQRVANILTNVETVTGGVAAQSEELQQAIVNFNAMAAEMAAAAKQYAALAQTLDQTITTDVQPIMSDLASTAASLERMAAELEQTVVDSRAPVTAFTNNSLPEAARFIAEARRLAASLARIAERLERDPAEFFRQGRQPEYEPR